MRNCHKLTTVLGILQDRGQKVAILTDGRMSGASGKVPAAIHVTPESEGRRPDRTHPGRATSSASTRSTARSRCSSRNRAETRVRAHIDLSDNEFGMGRESSLRSGRSPARPTRGGRCCFIGPVANSFRVYDGCCEIDNGR